MNILTVYLSTSPLLAMRFMSPGDEIFHYGGFRLKWYGLLIASAVLIGVNLSMWLAKKREVDADTIADLAIWLYWVRFQRHGYIM